MTAHASHANVNQFCCKVLANLAVNEANQVTIAAAGAIPVILKAMTAHAGHAGVNEQGCLALVRLARTHYAIQQAVKVAPTISPLIPYPIL